MRISPIMVIMAVALSMVPMSFADSSVMCVNSTHQEESALFNIDGNTTSFSVIEECPNGCSQDIDKCRPSGFARSIVIGLITIVSLTITAILLKKRNIFSVVGIILMSVIMLIVSVIDIFTGVERTIMLSITLFILGLLFVLAKDFLDERKNSNPLMEEVEDDDD